MVYERRTVDGAYKQEDFLNIIRHIEGQWRDRL